MNSVFKLISTDMKAKVTQIIGNGLKAVQILSCPDNLSQIEWVEHVSASFYPSAFSSLSSTWTHPPQAAVSKQADAEPVQLKQLLFFIINKLL